MKTLAAGTAILIVAFLAATTAARAEPTVYDNKSLGIALTAPEGYAVSLGLKGLLLVTTDPGDPGAPRAMVTHAALGAVVPAPEVAAQVNALLGQILPGYAPAGIAEVEPGLAVIRYRVRDGELDVKGVLFVRVLGSYVQLAGLSARADAYAAAAPKLLEILAGVKFGAPAMRFVAYREPREGAFTVLVPEGWKAVGQIDRRIIEANLALDLVDPTGRILVVSHQYEEGFVNPMYGFPEGRQYTPSPAVAPVLVRQFHGVEEYLRRRTPEGARLLGIRMRPDKADGPSERVFAQHLGFRYEAGRGVVRHARRELRLPSGDHLYRRHRQLVGQHRGLRGATGPLDEAETALAGIPATLACDPDWAMLEAKGALDRLRILAEAQTKVFEIIQDVTLNQAKTASGAAVRVEPLHPLWGRGPDRGTRWPGQTGTTSTGKLPGLIQQNPGIATNW